MNPPVNINVNKIQLNIEYYINSRCPLDNGYF